jgi:nitric oxide reductase large subunit
MTGKNRRIIILLPWLALPLLVGCYAALWPRLPAELAVQFDSSGAATNSLGRTQSLLLDSAILLFVLGRFTFKLWDAGERDARAITLTYYLAVIFITAVFLAILKFNL